MRGAAGHFGAPRRAGSLTVAWLCYNSDSYAAIRLDRALVSTGLSTLTGPMHGEARLVMCIRSFLLLTVLGATIWCVPALAADEPTGIFVMKVDGSEVRRVAEVKDLPQLSSPRWSRDASQLAFDAGSDASETRRLYVIGAEGDLLRPIGLGAHADWSPDDKQLVFTVSGEAVAGEAGAGEGESAPEIWVQNANGRGRLSLSAGGLAPRWSPRGGGLAVLDGGSLAILDLIDGTRRKLEVPGETLPGFDWSPDGTRLALVARAEDKHALWTVDAAGKDSPKKLLSGDVDGYLAWSPDGRRLAISLAGEIHLLNADGSGDAQPIAQQVGLNRMPAWSSDGASIAFVSTRKTPFLAPAVSRPAAQANRSLRLEEVRRHTRGAVVYGLDLTLDGRKVLLGGKRDLEIWDFESDTSKLVGLRGEWVAMSPDGHTIAQSGPLVKIALGDLNTGKPIRDVHVGTMCTNVRFSPDGKRIVTGTTDKQAQVFEVATGKRVCIFENHHAPITRVAFLPGGQEAVSNGQDQHTRIWNAETAQERLALAHPEVPWALAISPDGRFIATGTGGSTFDNPILHKMHESKENMVRLWDAASGELIREMPGHTDVVYSMVFSPDGRTLVTGSWDATMRLWDVETGRELASARGQGTVYALAITPDGTQIVAGGGENRSFGNPLRRYRDEQVRVYRIVEE